jgi:hypothetical protein
LEENAILAVTIIEIRPFRNGWKVFEAPGIEPVFLDQEQAIDYERTAREILPGIARQRA